LYRLSVRSGFKFPRARRGLLLNSLAGLTIGIVLGLTLFSVIGLPRILEPWNSELYNRTLLTFSSYEDLRDFLNRSGSASRYYYITENVNIFGVKSAADAAAGALDYSRTNIQVEGVDEADIIKTDGTYIYMVFDSGLIIARAYPPETAKVLSLVKFNGTVVSLFINGNKLVVFEQEYSPMIYRTEEKVPIVAIYPIYRGIETHVWIYDVENREKPNLIRQISVNGTYFTSRMIGNHVYLLTSQPAYLIQGDVYLPMIKYETRSEEVNATIKYDSHTEKVDASKVYYANVTDYSYGFTTVIAFDVTSLEAPRYEVFLVGATSAVYVSPNNIYVAIPKAPIFYEDSSVLERTEIHRVRIEKGEIIYEASGVVPGRVLNQFSMDEYKGNFRIATTTSNLVWRSGEATSKNHVYVLNMRLNITGKIENIAPGETIYSARFVGEKGYLVTFKKVDPFFVIDLKDPSSPKILGKLKISGYSDYLQPYDENHMIGIGKEAVEAKEGDFAWYQGVKISLFDVSNVENPVETGKYEIGDRGTDSPVLRDHKALLFDKKRNLLAMPVLVAEIDPKKYPSGVPANAYGDYVWQGLYIFDVSENGLTLRGRITHIDDAEAYLKSGYYFSSEFMVKRSFYIENVLYTVSDRKIKMNSLTDLEEIGELKLP